MVKNAHPDSNGMSYPYVWKIILIIILNENNNYMSVFLEIGKRMDYLFTLSKSLNIKLNRK